MSAITSRMQGGAGVGGLDPHLSSGYNLVLDGYKVIL